MLVAVKVRKERKQIHDVKHANDSTYSTPARSQEIIPDWFHQQKQGILPELDPIIAKRNRELIKKIIAKYSPS